MHMYLSQWPNYNACCVLLASIRSWCDKFIKTLSKVIFAVTVVGFVVTVLYTLLHFALWPNLSSTTRSKEAPKI